MKKIVVFFFCLSQAILLWFLSRTWSEKNVHSSFVVIEGVVCIVFMMVYAYFLPTPSQKEKKVAEPVQLKKDTCHEEMIENLKKTFENCDALQKAEIAQVTKELEEEKQKNSVLTKLMDEMKREQEMVVSQMEHCKKSLVLLEKDIEEVRSTLEEERKAHAIEIRALVMKEKKLGMALNTGDTLTKSFI